MAPYARREVFLIAVLGTALVLLVAWLLGWWALLPASVVIFLLSFYRDPPRPCPSDERLVLSPADGTIMSVERGYRGPEGGPAEVRICIFLSVFNVHVNRSPCRGQVRAIAHQAGKFLNAMKPEATLENENNLLTLDPQAPLPGPIRVRQIAGLLAKRIVCATQEGAWLAAGQRYGMIKLGSQTEIRMPDDGRWDVRVRAGDKVKGGLTILAVLHENA